MLSFRDAGRPFADGVSRREWLRVGGLSVLGISLAELLGASRSSQAAATADKTVNGLTKGLAGTMFGQAKNVIFLWLQGGPPQHETFDPKPAAPLEIRGPFQPIQTNVPGMQFCELLPRTAQRADKLAIIRSLATDDNNHDVSGYWVLTGYSYGPGSARQIKPSDWPYFGSVLKKVKPSEQLPALTSVWLPDKMRLNDNVTPAGQTGGFLGSMWDPERFVGDPASADYRIEGLTLPVEVSSQRMVGRSGLLSALNRQLDTTHRSGALENWSQLSNFALDLVTSGKAKAAFDLSREPESLRDRYGRHTWGQSCLLARRLIEAGVRLVHVNWPREPGDTAVDNPLWDTHAQNADRLQDFLCPIFDVTFAALLDDLEARGLLSETLVVAVGEFGRTPKINSQGGRDHWGPVFSCALAGAGISGGQVFGASDAHGAYPKVDAIRPHDLTATIYHLLGVPHQGVFHDRANRPHSLTKGEPLYRLLGETPATRDRVVPTGDERLVPPYDASPLVDTEFTSGKLVAVSPNSREKGWRASPWPTTDGSAVRIQLESQPTAHLAIGFVHPGGDQPITVPAGTKVIVAQEVRNARGGQYSFALRYSTRSSSANPFSRVWEQGVLCRLQLFRYANMGKQPLEARELANQPFQPAAASWEEPAEATVSRFLGSTVPGANFSIGNGLGVGLLIETRVAIELAPGDATWLQLRQARLDFQPRPRDENVTV
jgi:hypothetical protein